ncbi:GD15530 [Drosophila simulans]|uniref:GD15530 n=1 Tax=Drosophila simulans TaxID=7240 RepID=B4R3A3_DROSI|nr:GD15530 [Drosophila simulans]
MAAKVPHDARKSVVEEVAEEEEAQAIRTGAMDQLPQHIHPIWPAADSRPAPRPLPPSSTIRPWASPAPPTIRATTRTSEEPPIATACRVSLRYFILKMNIILIILISACFDKFIY